MIVPVEGHDEKEADEREDDAEEVRSKIKEKDDDEEIDV